MLDRRAIGAAVLMSALFTASGAKGFDDAKYPNLKGQWVRAEGSAGVGRFDPTKPPGRLREPPLTAEYQAIYEANLADQAAGGQGDERHSYCIPLGMPRLMTVVYPMEIVITPKTTYIMIDHIHDSRRIHTDGRDFPPDMADDPQFTGYSIGRWVDEDGDGRYDTLIVETRGMKGPRTYEMTGIPLHEDNQTIVRERIYLDKTDPNMLHDEITTIDHALTRPWTVTKDYRRTPTSQPIWWSESVCAENNVHISIRDEVYFLSGDGLLMPSKKDQPPPDLRYFNQSRN